MQRDFPDKLTADKRVAIVMDVWRYVYNNITERKAHLSFREDFGEREDVKAPIYDLRLESDKCKR